MKFAKKKLDEAIIVVDEAYLEFSSSVSATTLIKDYPNIVVLKTLSKAYALAGVRVGITIGNREIIKCLLKSLAPYPLPAPCIDIVDKALSPLGICYYQLKIKELIEQREMLTKELAKLPFVKKVFSSSTNFILLEVDNPDEIVQKLSVYNIAIKNKSKSVKNCIRISVGNQEQNSILLSALKDKNMVSNIRKVECSRITKETQIFVETILDNKSKGQINTGVGFFDHMLDQIKKHSGISLNILAKGDIEVDEHHLIEDTGILFGQCLKKALGNKVGIERYASNTLVMDEAKAAVSIDICDRAFFTFNGKIPQAKVGAFPSDMVFHFFDSIAKNLNATLNISVEGENSHHIIEVIFKCFAKTLKDAIKITSDQLMSTKGVM
jgi:histidinol-phosphate aminotransferase/imidazoleglycerol-phosphate dehydratase/histidinol-phosphatase